MNRYRAGTLGVVVFLVNLLCLAQAEDNKAAPSSQSSKALTTAAKQKGMNKFIGTWKLMSIDARRSNGEVTSQRYGPNPIGYLIYDTTGHMAVQIMRPDRPRFAADGIEQETAVEAKAAFDSYGAYFGTYEVNEAEGFVIHHVEGSIFPNYIGTEQKRFFELSGDQLVLKPPPQLVAGEQQILRVTWQRVK